MAGVSAVDARILVSPGQDVLDGIDRGPTGTRDGVCGGPELRPTPGSWHRRTQDVLERNRPRRHQTRTSVWRAGVAGRTPDPGVARTRRPERNRPRRHRNSGRECVAGRASGSTPGSWRRPNPGRSASGIIFLVKIALKSDPWQWSKTSPGISAAFVYLSTLIRHSSGRC